MSKTVFFGKKYFFFKKLVPLKIPCTPSAKRLESLKSGGQSFELLAAFNTFPLFRFLDPTFSTNKSFGNWKNEDSQNDHPRRHFSISKLWMTYFEHLPESRGNSVMAFAAKA